jgi:hypothetical protein
VLLTSCGGRDDSKNTQDNNDESSSVSGDTSEVTKGGRKARALAARGGSVIGAPDATMDSILDYSVNSTGQFVIVGSYKSKGENFNAIWAGTVEEPKLLFSTGHHIEGTVHNERYDHTLRTSLASDGSVAQVVKLIGSPQNEALVISSSEGQKAIIQTGDRLQGLTDEKTVGNITSISHSRAGTSFVSNDTLWLYQEGAFTAIADTDTPAPTIDNNCGYSFADDPLVSGVVLDSGSLFFNGHVTEYSSYGGCAATIRSAIVKYTGGSYQLVISDEQVVPGAAGSTFYFPRLFGVTDNGTLLVHSTLKTPAEGIIYGQWSLWAFPTSGSAPNLIALEGEEVQGEITKHTTISPFWENLNYNSSGDYALLTWVPVEGGINYWTREQSSIFSGKAHTSQPHGSIISPGPSSLENIADKATILPTPFKNSEYFSALGRPSVDSNGHILFYGELASSIDVNKVSPRSIWQADLNGNLTEVIREGDTILVEGVPKSLHELAQDNDYLERIFVTNNGAIFFFAEQSDNNMGRADVIVYIEPASK